MTNTSSNPSLGSRIRSLRLKGGLTQADLAKRARISTVYLRSLESGARPWPSWPVLTRLFAALGVRVLLKFFRQEEGSSTSVIDVLDRVLDKGIVIAA